MTTIGVAAISVLACVVGLWATVTGVVVGSGILVLATAAPARGTIVSRGRPLRRSAQLLGAEPVR